MRKLFFIITCVILISCDNEAGELENCHEEPHIKIHGVEYFFIKFYPEQGCHPVWIMIPVDSSKPLPTTLNWDVKSGKTTRDESVVIID